MRANDQQKKELERFLRLVGSAYLRAIRQFEDELVDICRDFDVCQVAHSELLLAAHSVAFDEHTEDGPVVDRPSLSIRWREATCFLGNTLLFRLYEKLSSRPNRYFRYSELLAEVWGGPRSTQTIHNLVKRLRDRLISSRMKPIADAIDGHVRDHYALRLDRLSGKDQTEFKP